MYFFAGFFWISPCVWPNSGFWSIFLSASTAATYIFTAPNCTSTIISLEPCTANAEYQRFILSCSISYWDLLKCLYFADTTEWGDRGWKEGQRQGEDRVTLHITLISHVQISRFLGEIWQLRGYKKRKKFENYTNKGSSTHTPTISAASINASHGKHRVSIISSFLLINMKS